jgi:hypothetical protein
MSARAMAGLHRLVSSAVFSGVVGLAFGIRPGGWRWVS